MGKKKGKGQCCCQCALREGGSQRLHTDTADGNLYCTPCWEAFYGVGTAPNAPRQGDNSLGAYLPPALAGLQAMTLAAHKDSGTAASGDGVASLADDQSSQPALPYRVNSTRGGGIPVAIEKRAKGKKVTVVSNVQGDSHALAKAMSKALGCGGTATPGEAVVQGERVNQVKTFLVKSGCLQGVSAADLAAAVGLGKAPTSSAAVVPTQPSPSAVTAVAADLPKLDNKTIKSMKPAEMKELLKLHGASTQGNKGELLARVVELFGSHP
eukprot:m.176465 g.176465  ORF g.176465 m.176465 type:complete len:268 (-) comp24444_c0_seq1:484-1287(-)